VNVCFFNRSYWPDTAATGQLLTELAEDLVRLHGCQVSVVCGFPLHGEHSRAGLRLVRRERHNGVNIFRAAGTTRPTTRFVGRASNYLTYFTTACLAGLMVPSPDVVVALTDPPIIGLAGLAAAHRAGAKFVFLCEDVFPEVASLLEDFHNETVNRTLERISRFLIRKADRVVVLGERMRERLVSDRHADPSRISIIHNWADCSAVAPGERRNAFSCEHGLADKFVVMHSGNVGLSQNLETLIGAAERLTAYPDLVIAIVGHGARLWAIQEMARAKKLANVRFLPQQPKERLAELFASADVFVVSLKRGIEGYIVPSKLYGILAAGRASIVAVDRSSEPASIVTTYECGLVAEPGDPDSLAAEIVTLYRDRALVARMAANAREAAYEFDRPRQVATYYRVLREVTGRT
jgi:colanic acid biosynthesis glycosyl transferase WcaI